MNYHDPSEMAERAYEHGQDDAAEGRLYIPHLYVDQSIQSAYLRGYRDAESPAERDDPTQEDREQSLNACLEEIAKAGN